MFKNCCVLCYAKTVKRWLLLVAFCCVFTRDNVKVESLCLNVSKLWVISYNVGDDDDGGALDGDDDIVFLYRTYIKHLQ